MTDHANMLRQAAAEMRHYGHDGWPNVCDWGADELDRLNAQALELCAQISGLRRENESMRHDLGVLRGHHHEGCMAEIERLRAGLQLIANDKHRLMNEVARQTAASVLGGKPIGEVAEWPKRDATSAQLAEEQRFIHGAAAVTGLTQQDYDALVRDAMLWRTRSPTGAGGNARAFMCCEGVGQHAPGCIAQEAAP